MSFLNNYHVLAAYIQLRGSDTVAICQTFNEFRGTLEVDTDALSKLLLNSWSAEYALRITPVVNDEQYLQSSLHWTFPQGYYSALFSARAFLLVQGFNHSNEDLIRRKIGSLVSRGYYPLSLGFYAFGLHGRYNIHRLPASVPLLSDFLSNTRDARVEKFARELQANPKTALRNPKTGEILVVKEFSVEQYRETCKQVGFTTYFDLMSRLRISSTDRDIEQYTDGTIDVRPFHASLVDIVSHINGIHEQYIIKAIGKGAYGEIVRALPAYLREGFLRDRLQTFNRHAESVV